MVQLVIKINSKKTTLPCVQKIYKHKKVRHSFFSKMT